MNEDLPEGMKVSHQVHQLISIDSLLSANNWEDYQNEPFVKIEKDWAEYKLYTLTTWIDYNLKILILYFLFFDNYKQPELILEEIWRSNEKMKKTFKDGFNHPRFVKLFRDSKDFRAGMYGILFDSKITLTPLVDNFLNSKLLRTSKLDLKSLRDFIIERNKVFHKYYIQDNIEIHIEEAINLGISVKKYFDNFILIDFGTISQGQKEAIIHDLLVPHQAPGFIALTDIMFRGQMKIPPECLNSFLSMLKSKKDSYTNGYVVLNGLEFTDKKIYL